MYFNFTDSFSFKRYDLDMTDYCEGDGSRCYIYNRNLYMENTRLNTLFSKKPISKKKAVHLR